MSDAFMDCDRNICYQNGVSGIECEDCEVTKQYRREKYKIHVDIENIVCARDDSYVTYECFVPVLRHPGESKDFVFYLDGKRLDSWPEYVYCIRCGNCIIYNDLPKADLIDECAIAFYYIADRKIKYYYRVKEIKDEVREMRDEE